MLGSAAMMSDTYIDKEDNSRVKDVILSFLTSDEVVLNKIDAEDPEVSDYTMIPDTNRLSELPRVCLQESEEIPPDYTRSFDAVSSTFQNIILSIFQTLQHSPIFNWNNCCS